MSISGDDNDKTRDCPFKPLYRYFSSKEELDCFFYLKKCISYHEDLYHTDINHLILIHNERNTQGDKINFILLHVINNVKQNVIVPEINLKMESIQNTFYLRIFNKILNKFNITDWGDDFYSSNVIDLDVKSGTLQYYQECSDLITDIVNTDIYIPVDININAELVKEKNIVTILNAIDNYLSTSKESIMCCFKYIASYISQYYTCPELNEINVFLSKKTICLKLIDEIEKILSLNCSVSCEIILCVSSSPNIPEFLKQLIVNLNLIMYDKSILSF